VVGILVVAGVLSINGKNVSKEQYKAKLRYNENKEVRGEKNPVPCEAADMQMQLYQPQLERILRKDTEIKNNPERLLTR
jgi:hypothetical protein